MQQLSRNTHGPRDPRLQQNPGALPPLCNRAFATSWAAGKHLSAALTASPADLKSITPAHRARLLPTETIKLQRGGDKAGLQRLKDLWGTTAGC